MNIWVSSLLIGFIASVFASGFFYLFLWILKPRIGISPTICYTELSGVPVYGFKVINKTWFYRVLDVKIELLLLENVNSDGGQNTLLLKSIKLRRDQIWYIKRRYFCEKGSFAVVFHTDENLNEIWDSYSKRLQFQIVSKHSLSGFSKVFTQTYYRKSAIKNGMFKFGDSFAVS